MSATDSLGPHLLGRRYEPDARDWHLGAFLQDADPLDAALQAVLSSWDGKKTKTWAKLITERVKSLGPAPTPIPPSPTPTPTPAPTPTPSGDVVWADTDAVLDQGQTGHCVGFGWAGGWGNTLPVDDHFVNADGDAVYYAAKVIDGEPNQENGSSVRSGAKAMQQRGRLKAYAFAASVDEAIAWIVAHGPVVFGTDWLANMFNVDANGYVDVSGNVAGGHCYACVGWHPSMNALEFINSWGAGWGVGPNGGRFFIRKADAEALFASQGEICAAVELP